MMIKVSNEFLDFDEEIDVEKQIKLFEDISTTDGDFSYSFDLQKTLNNTKLLGNPFPDNINKPVYQRIPAKILGDSGAELYDGYLRVERVTSVYSCSFFAGNNNWFGMIHGLLSDLDLSRFDVEQTVSNIEASWLRTEGLVFPLVDNGGLLTRSYNQLKIEDFVGAFYVKTIFNQIFVEAGIKIQGELLNDWMFNNITCLKNSKSQAEIDARSVFVQKTITQTINDASEHVIEWDNDSTYPYFNNGLFNLGTESYTTDVGTIVNVEFSIKAFTYGLVSPTRIFLRVNGVDVDLIFFAPFNPGANTFAGSFKYRIQAGDVVTLAILAPFTTDLLSGTLKITPTFIYKTFGKSAVPNWTKQQFVSNILRAFNVLASYEEGNHTLTLNLFERIKSKPAIDLSEFISDTEVDYSEFISDYGQNSIFSYNEVEFEELKSYNVGKYFKYAQGKIVVDNDFLEPNVDVIQSNFSNPIAYINGVFDMSMERTNLIELDEGDNQEVGSVSDNSGVARFAITEDIFLVGDLVRITGFINASYNGDWIVSAIGTGWVEFNGLPFDLDDTGTLTKLDYTYANSDDAYLTVNIPNYDIEKFSGKQNIIFETNTEETIGLAYFDLINTGRQINIDFIYSLSFGGIDDPLHYQITMIEQYFRLFSRVLNDPVKLLSVCHLPYALFVQIDFLSPIKIRTFETTNEYYLNRISGYKESFLPCQLELIKI